MSSYSKDRDKCCICGYVDVEEEFEKFYESNYDSYGLQCPNCGSFDIEPADYDPYEDDEELDDDLLI